MPVLAPLPLSELEEGKNGARLGDLSPNLVRFADPPGAPCGERSLAKAWTC